MSADLVYVPDSGVEEGVAAREDPVQELPDVEKRLLHVSSGIL